MATTAKWTVGCLQGTGMPAQGGEFPGDSAWVLVLPAGADVTHTTHWELKQQTLMSHGSGGCGPQSGRQCGQALARALLQACRHLSLRCLRVGGHQSHHKGLHVTTSSNFHYLPKASPPKTIMLGVRASTCEVRGGHQHSIHTVLPSDTWNSTPERSTF